MIASALGWLAAPVAAAWFAGSSASLESPRRLFENGRYREVVAELSEARVQQLRSADQAKAYLYLGSSLSKLGRLDRALGVFQLGVKIFPRDINLLTELARLLHQSGLEEQAEPVYQRVLKLHPNNAEAHLGLGELDRNLGFLDRSAEHYEKALETMASDPAVWRDYAEVLLAARDYKTAELAARRSLGERDDPTAAFLLASALRAEGRLDEALTSLGEAVGRFPASRELPLTRGLWLLEAGRYEDARLAVQPLFGKDTPPLAYWIRARVALKDDRYNEAVADLRAAVALERRSPFVAAASRELLKQLGAAR